MANGITVNFVQCEVEPKGGYMIFYRPVGSLIPYRNGGVVTSSPAVVVDATDPDGTQYEGYIQTQSDGGTCNHVPFTTVVHVESIGTIANIEGSNIAITGAFFGRYLPGEPVPNDYYPITVDGGYYVNPGESRRATINDKYNNTVSNLLIYFTPPDTFLGVRLVDSDGNVQCLSRPNEGSGVHFYNVRLSNADGFTITLLSTAC